MLFFLKKKYRHVVNVSFGSMPSGGKLNPSSVTFHIYILGSQEINQSQEKKIMKL